LALMIDLNALPLPELFRTLAQSGDVSRLISAAFAEDVGRAGDITTESLIDADVTAMAAIAVRASGVVAGHAVIEELSRHASGLKFDIRCADSDRCTANATIATVRGPLREILGIERPMLNLLGHLSGIATLTRQYVIAITGTKAVICDTRKTTPGLRTLEKYAVRCGGGTLHRMGLSDAALYKDNHLATIPRGELATRLRTAITRLRASSDVRFVEVEVDCLEQMMDLLPLTNGFIDIMLLDNMPLEALQEAVKLRDARAPRLKLEASGGITLANVRDIAQTGVDRISVGAITHSAPWLDIGLDIST
jgi:nicotinate-nucleotide pyrophosphorylase (carboxylating)